MTKPIEVHAYLAGPDVFFPGASAIGLRKKAELSAVGIKAHFPGDTEAPPDVLADKARTATWIAEANERLMLECCQSGRIGIIFINMTPYHGPSMDVGSAFEAGFMSALAATNLNIVIIGYTEDKRTFEERVIDHVYGGNSENKDGRVFGADGRMIEAFGKSDNLMITNAIEKTGGAVVHSFEDAVAFAKKLAEAKIAKSIDRTF